jgi:hypothetical protein
MVMGDDITIRQAVAYQNDLLRRAAGYVADAAGDHPAGSQQQLATRQAAEIVRAMAGEVW